MNVDTSASNGNYIRISDVARALGLSKPTVRSLVKRGDIAPALQIGGMVLIPQASLESYMQRATIQPSQAA